MGLTVNILTSGFLVTVIIFFVLMAILFREASVKLGEVLLAGDNRSNNLEQVDSAFNAAKVAYILAAIAAIITLILAILYAGHEIAINPSEYWHLALYLITYILLIVSVVYAFIALTRIYSLGIVDRNGADAFLWAGLLMAVFAFVGLTATGSGRLGMNIVRSDTRRRLEQAEANINEHLPAVRARVEQTASHVSEHLPITRAKIDELHASALVPSELLVTSAAPSQVVSTPVVSQVVTSSPRVLTSGAVVTSAPVSSLQRGSPVMMRTQPLQTRQCL